MIERRASLLGANSSWLAGCSFNRLASMRYCFDQLNQLLQPSMRFLLIFYLKKGILCLHQLGLSPAVSCE